MIKLRHQLVTRFHRELADDAWLQALSERLSRHPALAQRTACGVVSSGYNEDRYMGPQSVCKYRFGVDLLLESQPRSPVDTYVWAHLEFWPLQQELWSGGRLREATAVWPCGGELVEACVYILERAGVNLEASRYADWGDSIHS